TIEISSENNSPITFNKESTVKLSIFKLLHLLCTTLYQYDIAFQFVHVYNIKSIKRTINWTSFIIQKTTRLFHLYLFMYDINFPSLVYTGLTFLFISDRKSTRLNSSHVSISYAVFCLKKKTTNMRK